MTTDSGDNKRGQMKTILVIDDERQIRIMLRKMLENEGYHILDASDGNEAINIYKENEIDLVITDLIMPEKEGLETIFELKQKAPDMKIIAMSGGGRNKPDTYLDLAKRAGASLTFVKPIRKKDLIEAVNKLIGA